MPVMKEVKIMIGEKETKGLNAVHLCQTAQ